MYLVNGSLPRLRQRYCIRLAGRADLHVLPRIELMAARRFARIDGAATLMSLTLPLEVLEQRQTEGRVWVACDTHDDKCRPVGFATSSVVDGLGHLEELSVLPQHGRRGLGGQLVQSVCTWALELSLRAVTLVTMRSIPWNQPFYERLGFREIPPQDLGAGLRRLREAEARAGLPVDRRVCMRREV
jgi:GNAT superfamily N-acetyltransferase